MFHLVYGLYSAYGKAGEWERMSFASRAKALKIPLPVISAIVNIRWVLMS